MRHAGSSARLARTVKGAAIVLQMGAVDPENPRTGDPTAGPARTARTARLPRSRVALGSWAVGLVVVVAVLVVGLSGKGAGPARSAPPLPTQALVGSPITLAALLRTPVSGGANGAGGTAEPAGAGRTHAAIVLFWASWCAPCQHEAPAVERFAQSTAGHGRIVGIAYGENASSAPRAFVRRYRWTFPNLSDPDAHAGEKFGVVVLPSTFVIDARGRISETLRGPQTEQSLAHALATAES